MTAITIMSGQKIGKSINGWILRHALPCYFAWHGSVLTVICYQDFRVRLRLEMILLLNSSPTIPKVCMPIPDIQVNKKFYYG